MPHLYCLSFLYWLFLWACDLNLYYYQQIYVLKFPFLSLQEFLLWNVLLILQNNHPVLLFSLFLLGPVPGNFLCPTLRYLNLLLIVALYILFVSLLHFVRFHCFFNIVFSLSIFTFIFSLAFLYTYKFVFSQPFVAIQISSLAIKIIFWVYVFRYFYCAHLLATDFILYWAPFYFFCWFIRYSVSKNSYISCLCRSVQPSDQFSLFPLLSAHLKRYI